MLLSGLGERATKEIADQEQEISTYKKKLIAGQVLQQHISLDGEYERCGHVQPWASRFSDHWDDVYEEKVTALEKEKEKYTHGNLDFLIAGISILG
mgnify:CR=1 FL=1